MMRFGGKNDRARGKEKVEQMVKKESVKREKRSEGRWKRKVEGRRKHCFLLTSKSHGNARSPARAPSNQTHTLSQACFNTLHAHNRVSNSAVNN